MVIHEIYTTIPYSDDIDTDATDLEMETIIADDNNSAVAMEVALTQIERVTD